MDARSFFDAEALLTLARAAGDAVLSVYERGIGRDDVAWKADDSPLTEADRVSHDVICSGLASWAPGIPVISEEGRAADRQPPAGGLYWLVDPLDGTKEFIKRTGEFTVNIALMEGSRPVAGLVYAPVLAKAWVGGPAGAALVDGDRRLPLRVAAASPERLRLVASRDHAGPKVQALLDRLTGAATLSMGSSLKFCLIAEGRADLYLRDGPTSEWDTAAAQAVLEAAGGGVFTLDGRPLAYGKPTLRNPEFIAVGDLGLDWQAVIREPARSA